MEERVKKNPWLGLESYREGEILYGRDNDIRDLTQSVLNDIDTLLYGKSGIGKSSILNAGILPAARRHGYLPVMVRLSHKEHHTYLAQIKNAIANAMIPIPLDESGNQIPLSEEEYKERKAQLAKRIVKVVRSKDEEKESLYEYFHRFTFHDEKGERVKLLVIFDQFEEIFTLQSDEVKKKHFFEEMGDFLNDVMPSELQFGEDESEEVPEKTEILNDGDLDDLFDDLDLEVENKLPEYVSDNEIHMVFTIREDFLSEFEYYTASIPSLKQNRYGLRPINEEQAAQIVLRPMPGLISELVAKLIIEKVTGRTDFELDGVPEIEVDSAVLSLYLNRLYEAKSGDKITAALVEKKGGEIIADFYRDAISDISQSSVEYLEDMLLNGQGRRDNITIFDAMHDGGVTETELDVLCNKKKILRQFNYAGDLRIEYVHDILCPVVKEHKDTRVLQKQQEEERQRQEEEKRKLLLEEKTKRETIEREAAEEKARMRAEAIRTKKRNRRRMILIGSFFSILLLSFLTYLWYYEWEHESYYAQFERVNGWPVGVGEPLSIEERTHLPLYYKLSHKGHSKYDTDVEVCSSNERLPRIPRIFCLEVSETDTDVRAREYINMLSHIKSIHFEAGEKDRLNKEIVRGENDSVLYYVNYFYLETKGLVWANFVSSQGQAMQVRDNGLDRIKMSWFVSDDVNDKRNGRVVSMMYFDALGVSKAGANGVFGYQMDYSKDGLTSTLYSLDEYGRPFDALYNVKVTTRGSESVDIRYAYARSVQDSILTPALGPNGFWREVNKRGEKLYYRFGETEPSAKCLIKTNKRGNTLQLKMEGKYPATIPAETDYTYAETTGYRVSEKMLNADGSPFKGKDGIYMRQWLYDESDALIMEKHYNTEGKLVFAHFVKKEQNIVRDETRNVSNKDNPVIIRIDSLFENCTSSSFYGDNNKPINIIPVGVNALCHRIVKEQDENLRTTKYFYYDEEIRREVRQRIGLNADGVTVASYYCKKETVDDDGNVVSCQILNEDEHVVKSMLYFYQNGQNTGRAVMGIEGNPVRCPNWEEEGFAYYKLYFTKDFANHFASAIGVNEWGKSSIFYDASVGQYVRISRESFKKGELEDDSLGKYPLLGVHEQFVFKKDKSVSNVTIPYVHILDKESPLYTYNHGQGLKDGDRMVLLGNWKWGHSETILANEWKKLSKEPVEMEILRPMGNGYQKLSFRMNTDGKQPTMAEYHMLALTDKELQMIKQEENENH